MHYHQCLVANIAGESYGYAYVTDKEDFSDLPSYWDELFDELSVSVPVPFPALWRRCWQRP